MHKRKDGQDFLLNIDKGMHEWLRAKANEESTKTFNRTSMTAIIIRILNTEYEKDQKQVSK
jgi:hypothetical protein